jgi:hypothetical protein
MKLETYEWTNKDGATVTEYRVKKTNEFGVGLVVGEELSIKLSFKPTIKDVPYTDKKTGAKKTFTSVKLLGIPDPMPEDIILHPQYGNAVFQVPEKFAGWVKDCQPEDVVTVYLRAFEVEGKKKATWDCKINGKGVAKDKQTKFADTDVREKHIPDQLVGDWIENIKTNAEGFKNAFVDSAILSGSAQPTAFFDWLDNGKQCETDIFENAKEHITEESLNKMKAKLFWAIVDELGLDNSI